MKLGDTVHWYEASNHGTENLCVFSFTGIVIGFQRGGIVCKPREGFERNVQKDMVSHDANIARKAMHESLVREKTRIDRRYNEVLADLK